MTFALLNHVENVLFPILMQNRLHNYKGIAKMAVIKYSEYTLAGDIGGTKTNLGLFEKGKRRPVLKYSRTYLNAEFNGLEDIIEIFLEKHPYPVATACFGIAGPVQNGRCRTTNLPWEVQESRIEKRFIFRRARLLNDLSATALAIPCLSKNELHTLNVVRVKKGQNIGLIAPGTGLGQAQLFFHEGRYFPIPSEGGHTDFAPQNEIEIRLWRYLSRQYGHVSIERLLSGPGIFSIYKFLKSEGSKEPEWLSKKIRRMDPARAISEAALERGQKLCVKTLDLFISILGSAAGNLALTGMTTGGMYLAGGIPPKILPMLVREKIFMTSFTNKGRFKQLLEKMPVHVVLNERAALLGAAVASFSE